MKVTVCHGRLTRTGGGKRVAIILTKVFDADLFVGNYTPEKTYEKSGALQGPWFHNGETL